MVIGVSGVAGSGKDLFTETLIQELNKRGKKALRVALADCLKKEARWQTLEMYGVDALSCTREEKEEIRDFLVEYGTNKRKQTDGRYWIEKATSIIEEQKNNYDYICISDIRYDEHSRDEVEWLKQEMSGLLVHISKWSWFKDVNEGALVRRFIEPANSNEERNDPCLQAKADFKLEWEHAKKINKDKYISSEVVKFIEWLDAR